MSKKLGWFCLVLIGLVFSIGVFFVHRGERVFSNEECPFCNLSVLERQTFYEDDLVLALYTYKPIIPGHCLVIPKRHVERFEVLSDLESMQICQTIKKVNSAVEKVFGTSSYLILQKNGREVGQSVPHVHFHYIPRKTGDDSVFLFLFKMFGVQALGPMDPAKLQEAVTAMREAI